ncbi:endonuclease domain of the non-LTR retrotransposon LINE-1 [Elysia marginata]|uniref:Endonuclease domain of the non-LTR retrotransposon LINE-1 n=1 Tax=Elysia marginata TaxID=1093978 RepID=A0AAV4ITS2_9GAST|nr:endonuclease domain of the non-LTR retrotransposon LINE-1 [Elysia marginata]
MLTVSARPFYLPREFSKLVIITVYLPPDGNYCEGKECLIQEIEKQKETSPDSVIIVNGDFNKCKFGYPGFTQYVDCSTRGEAILDLFFVNIKNAYRCFQQAPLENSDHATLSLLPEYRPIYKRSKPVKKFVEFWNVCEKLQDCFESTDWSVFVDACDDVNELTEHVTDYFTFCVENVVEKKEVVVYPNNKPWIIKTTQNPA